jgi:hypothetical protein
MLNPHRDVLVSLIKSIGLLQTEAHLKKLQAEIEEAPEEVQITMQRQTEMLATISELLTAGLDTADELSTQFVAFSLN